MALRQSRVQQGDLQMIRHYNWDKYELNDIDVVLGNSHAA